MAILTTIVQDRETEGQGNQVAGLRLLLSLEQAVPSPILHKSRRWKFSYLPPLDMLCLFPPWKPPPPLFSYWVHILPSASCERPIPLPICHFYLRLLYISFGLLQASLSTAHMVLNIGHLVKGILFFIDLPWCPCSQSQEQHRPLKSDRPGLFSPLCVFAGWPTRSFLASLYVIFLRE